MFTHKNIDKMNLEQVQKCILEQNYSKPLLMRLLLDKRNRLLCEAKPI